MSTVTASALRFRYPAQERWALDGLDFSSAPGKVTWLTGALGSGTSTALLAFAGLAPRLTGGERRGSILVDGHDPGTLKPIAAGVAYLGATPSLQLSGIARTVRDEIAVGPMNLGWPRDRIVRTVDQVMERWGVNHLSGRNPTELSGGETQRVLLAALAATSPKLWLLDEPFSALDHASCALVAEMIAQVARDGATVIVASDDVDTIAPVAQRLVVLAQGRVVLDGSPVQILAGDAILDAGAGTTDAASLAYAAGWPAPRPLDSPALLSQIPSAPPDAPPTLPHATPSGGTGAGPILALNEVGFHYPGGTPVFANVSFQLFRGEAIGLFGPNGAGKSTLLRLAMALEHPSAGRVCTLDTDTARHAPEDFAPRVGFLFQQPERQLFATSVRAECAVALHLAGWTADRIEGGVRGVLDELGLADVADDHPYDLPLPRRRLVALASILVAGPELVLLDEPTAGLDATSRERVIRVLRKRVAGGLSVLAITHDASFAHETLVRAIQLREGRMISAGPVREVLDGTTMLRPAALAVAVAYHIPAGHDRRDDIAAMLVDHGDVPRIR